MWEGEKEAEAGKRVGRTSELGGRISKKQISRFARNDGVGAGNDGGGAGNEWVLEMTGFIGRRVACC